MFSEAMPISRRKPTQNWCVLHTFRTLGMPTRTVERSLGGGGGPAESFFPNQVCNIWKGIFGLFDFGLDDLHLVQVFDESLGAGVVHDHALPAERERHLAPGAALATGQRDVDKAALAIYRAPVADGFLRGGRLIGQVLDHVKAAELRHAALFPPVERNERRT